MMVKIQGASVSPCRAPAIISKNSVSVSGDKTLAFESVHKCLIAATISYCILYALKTFNIFSLRMLSKAFLKLMNTSAAFRLFSLTSSINLLRPKIYAIVDLPCLNPF